ncbi:MAG TPA: MFS transporter [Alphaproteobacteria bacterium]
MIATVRPILVLLVAAFLMMAGSGVLNTVVSVRLAAAGTPTLAIGVVSAMNFAGLTLGSLFAFRTVLAVGHIRAFSAFAAMFAAAVLGHAMHLDPAYWGVLRLVEGFCLAGLFICVESWLNHAAMRETRGQTLALYTISLYAGQGLGQLLLNLDGENGMLVFAAISMLLSLALVPVALTRMAPPVLPAISSFTLRRLYQASPLGAFGTLISGVILGSLYSLAPVYARGLGLDLSETALFMTAAILGGVVLQWPLGRLSDIFDRRRVIIGLFAGLVCVSAAMVTVSGRNFGILIAAVSLFGGVSFALYPLCVAHTNDHLDKDDMIPASGGLVFAYSIGATLGPLGASSVMDVTDVAGLFIFTGATGLLAVVIGVWRMLVRPPVPNALQARYHALPQTTPVAVPLDPRVDAD